MSRGRRCPARASKIDEKAAQLKVEHDRRLAELERTHQEKKAQQERKLHDRLEARRREKSVMREQESASATGQQQIDEAHQEEQKLDELADPELERLRNEIAEKDQQLLKAKREARFAREVAKKAREAEQQFVLKLQNEKADAEDMEHKLKKQLKTKMSREEAASLKEKLKDARQKSKVARRVARVAKTAQPKSPSKAFAHDQRAGATSNTSPLDTVTSARKAREVVVLHAEQPQAVRLLQARLLQGHIDNVLTEGNAEEPGDDDALGSGSANPSKEHSAQPGPQTAGRSRSPAKSRPQTAVPSRSPAKKSTPQKTPQKRSPTAGPGGREPRSGGSRKAPNTPKPSAWGEPDSRG